jgi:hypothetical protein
MSAEGLEPERPAPDSALKGTALKGTEALLASLRPTAPALDRDRVMYEAGRTAERRELMLGGSGASRGSSARRAGMVAALAASLLIGVWVGDRRARDHELPVPEVNVVQKFPPAERAAPAGEPVGPIVLPADSYGRLRKHLAAADFDDPAFGAERSHVAPASKPQHFLRSELLRSLN